MVAIPSGAFGGYAEYAVAPATMAFPMPESIPLPDAAAILMPFHLAALSLVRAGRACRDGRDGADPRRRRRRRFRRGAAGRAAGAHGDRARGLGREGAVLRAQLGADVAVDTSATDFVDAALEATGGRGVDVAFDTIGGEITTRTFGCMAFNGRHVLAGFASGIEAEDEGHGAAPDPVRELLARRRVPRLRRRPARGQAGGRLELPVACRRARRCTTEVLDLVLGRGDVRPIVGLDVPFDELPTALDAMERRRTVGRIVVRL